MSIYILTARDTDGRALLLERIELANDSESFPAAGRLLEGQSEATHVEVFQGERPVLSRHREAPIIRQVAGPAATEAQA